MGCELALVRAGRGGGHAREEPGDARPHGPVLPPAPAQRHPAQRTALPRVSGVCVCGGVCVCWCTHKHTHTHTHTHTPQVKEKGVLERMHKTLPCLAEFEKEQQTA